MKILIVEDESIIAFSMKAMLAELGYNDSIISNTEEQARALLENNNYGMVILDINLKNGDEGLNLAKICHVKSIPFFYVTSYTDKVTLDRAIETAPGAYIIKPFLPSSLYTAIELTLSSQTKPESNYITFKDGNDTIRLETSELIYLKADGVYIELVTENKKFLTRNSLKNLMESLPEKDFTQTHRAYIINNKSLTKICTTHIELGEYHVPLSRTFKNNLMSIQKD